MKSVTTSIAIGEPFACPHDSLYQALVESAAKQPEHPAMIFYQTQISYQNLLQQVEQFSAFLASKGVVKGDRVAIMLPNCPQYVIAFYACARIGAVVVQVNPMYVPREVEFTVQDAGAKVLVVYDPLYATLHEQEWVQHLSSVVTVSFAAGTDGDAGGNVTAWERMLQTDVPVPAAAEIDPAEDVAVLQYTGGTTGRSKGAMLTHRNLVANAWQSIQILGGNAIKPEDKILSVIPLFHVYGMSICMNMAIFCGSTMVILPRFQLEEVLQTIKTHQPRFFPGVPTMYVAIANHPQAHEYGVDSIEICNSGSAPLPLEVMRLFEEKTGAMILEGYGLSEASPVTHSNRVGGPRITGSIGPVFPGTEARIVDLATGEHPVPIGELGELIVRGPQVMKGYWYLPEETAVTLRGEWLHTGDIGRMDENGYFYIVDRKKDMIIAGGYNVYPRDVEEVLYGHPSVQEVVVVGTPDEYRGETVKAVVVLKQGIAADPAEVQADLDLWCRDRLAPFKIPRVYEFRTELPKTAVGKILRRSLREQPK